MVARLSRRRIGSDNTWPGFVDALSSMLLVIIFLLSVFLLAQFFLGQALSERLAELADQQEKLGTGLEKMLASGEAGSALDDASKGHLRNMDVHLKMMLENEGKGRDRLVEDLRGEFKLLARTIAALAEAKSGKTPGEPKV